MTDANVTDANAVEADASRPCAEGDAASAQASSADRSAPAGRAGGHCRDDRGQRRSRPDEISRNESGRSLCIVGSLIDGDRRFYDGQRLPRGSPYNASEHIERIRMSASTLPRTKPAVVGLSDAALARAERVLQSEVARGRLPGYVSLVARRGQIASLTSHGLLDPAGGAAMQTDSIFRIYSMTKPIVSLAVMMLLEEGRLLLSDPVASVLPAFRDLRVGVERDGKFDLVRPARMPTIRDLLRHTAGFTYEFTANGPVNQMYSEARLADRNRTNEQFCDALAKLPLFVSPGERWEYSRATDVLGRIVEVVGGDTLGAFLRRRIFEPLRMVDTAFHVPAAKHGRIAEPFAADPDSRQEVRLIDVRREAAFESGGGGLVSTAPDYANFLQMGLDGGRFDGQGLVGRKTLELMGSDHLGTIPSLSDLLPGGTGFGLGFAVRRENGLSDMAGSAGTLHWGGIAGTTFWVDPAEQFFAILLTQAPGQRDYYRPLYRNLIYATLD